MYNQLKKEKKNANFLQKKICQLILQFKMNKSYKEKELPATTRIMYEIKKNINFILRKLIFKPATQQIF